MTEIHEIGVDEHRLRRLRLGAGLSQGELADRAGISVDTVSRWERGEGKRPHVSRLRKVAKALGVTPDALLTDYWP